ncbi:pyrophosphatase PpaX [Paenibacillus abyssi]|uniref:Pyrophosphatase PpaX n=1 Tax=Paenibacillus abyssi TaxID=1340531 RepID=A0A917D0L4_9BACL|nr:pyrophosphatase PpaX [Paenibacillus abyssi]GGG05100.1 pyrophosphatase PpaX [Paenibacillus abyssi]
MTTKIQTVLFDLDGTILDTNELIIQSFIHALKDIVPTDFNREHIIPSMGHPLAVQMQLFSQLEDVSHLVAEYRKINLQLHDELVRPFPHVLEVLEALHSAGLQLGVVTTKMRMTTERGLKYVGLWDWMSSIVTMDDVQHPKPHPEPVQRAVRELNADPSSTLMVGDSGVDMESALAAGVIPVGVAWSLKGEAKLWEAGAKHMLHDMRDLYEIVGLERGALEKG